MAWDTTDPEHAFVVQPETLQTLLCADVALDECNLTANVFASAVRRSGPCGADPTPGSSTSQPPANVSASVRSARSRGSLAGCPLPVRRCGAAPRPAHVAPSPPAAIWRSPGRLGLGPAPRRRGAHVAGGPHRRHRRPSPACCSAPSPVRPIWRLIAGGLGVIVVPRFPLLLAAPSASGRSSPRRRSRSGRAGAPSTSPRPTACGRSERAVSAAWLWARADLRRRWTSSILLALLVAVPVGASLALVAGARRASRVGRPLRRLHRPRRRRRLPRTGRRRRRPRSPTTRASPASNITSTVAAAPSPIDDQRARLRARRRRRGVAWRARSTGCSSPGATRHLAAPTRSCSTSGAPTSTGSRSGPECRSTPSSRSSRSSRSRWARPRSSGSSAFPSTSSTTRPPRR